MKKLLLLLLVSPLILLSGPIDDISFTDPRWVFDEGVTYDDVTGILTIVGDASEYRKARIVIEVPAGTQDIYLSSEVYLSDIVNGLASWYTPKFKILDAAGSTALNACNFASPTEYIWYSTYCLLEDFNNASDTQIMLEYGMQNCSGTMQIKFPQVSDDEPVVTPYSFPYSVPTDKSCNLNLVSSDKVAFNNDLLSSNCHFSWASYEWGDSEVSNIINNDFPQTNYRFPGGTVGNFYDYTTDGYQDHYSTFDNASREALFIGGFTFDYPGFKNQVVSSSGSATLVFNVIHDSSSEGADRLTSRLADGLNIEWIELGNENYFADQAFGNIAAGDKVASVDNYISHTQSLTTALKSVDPSVKVSVAIDHGGYAYEAGGWTDRLSEETYYDAATLHNYISTWNENLIFTSGQKLLQSYKETRTNIEKYKGHFGTTPLIVTEWGIQGAPESFLSVIAYADIFMALLEANIQDGILKQSGIHMFYHSDRNQPQTLIYYDGSTVKYTPTGAFYSKLFELFKNADVYTALSSSEELESGLPGIISKAIDYGDSIKVFSVNKLPEAGELNITLDGEELAGDYITETYSIDPETGWPAAFSSPNEPWLKSTGEGNVSLPAYSLNITTVAKGDLSVNSEELVKRLISAYPNPSNGFVNFNGVKPGEQIEILDMNGRVVLDDVFRNKAINVKGLASGVYYVKVADQNIKLILK